MIARIVIATALALAAYLVSALFLPHTPSVLIGVAVWLLVFFRSRLEV